jgi:hypothetical protein
MLQCRCGARALPGSCAAVTGELYPLLGSCSTLLSRLSRYTRGGPPAPGPAANGHAGGTTGRTQTESYWLGCCLRSRAGPGRADYPATLCSPTLTRRAELQSNSSRLIGPAEPMAGGHTGRHWPDSTQARETICRHKASCRPSLTLRLSRSCPTEPPLTGHPSRPQSATTRQTAANAGLPAGSTHQTIHHHEAGCRQSLFYPDWIGPTRPLVCGSPGQLQAPAGLT